MALRWKLVAIALSAWAVARHGLCEESFGIPQLAGGKVDARVVTEPSGIFRFEYRVRHEGAKLEIHHFVVDVSSTQDRERLSGEGLTFVEMHATATTELAISRAGEGNYVPVGVAAQPAGWLSGVIPPAKLMFGAYQAGARAQPGQTRPFVVTSRGLPGIREVVLAPDIYDYAPNIDEEDVDPVAVAAAMERAAERLKSVGPVAPPRAFDLRAFADSIRALRAEAATLGWIRASADIAEIDARLADVRAQLAAGAYAAARDSAAAFIAAVERASCSELDCPADRPLTAEARALLALNMAFLRERVPASDAQ